MPEFINQAVLLHEQHQSTETLLPKLDLSVTILATMYLLTSTILIIQQTNTHELHTEHFYPGIVQHP